MNEWRHSAWWNPAAWYTGLGMGLLGFSLWVPWLSASRTTRIEERADDTAGCLLEAAMGYSTAIAEPEVETLLARAYMLAWSRGVRINDLARVEPAPPGVLLCLRNKHYAFQVTESPPRASERAGSDTVPALEVVAWPLSRVGPGHCAFFYPQNAERAYTRNLRADYGGFDDHRPLPGEGHRSTGIHTRRWSIYVGGDGERWILY